MSRRVKTDSEDIADADQATAFAPVGRYKKNNFSHLLRKHNTATIFAPERQRRLRRINFALNF